MMAPSTRVDVANKFYNIRMAMIVIASLIIAYVSVLQFLEFDTRTYITNRTSRVWLRLLNAITIALTLAIVAYYFVLIINWVRAQRSLPPSVSNEIMNAWNLRTTGISIGVYVVYFVLLGFEMYVAKFHSVLPNDAHSNDFTYNIILFGCSATIFSFNLLSIQ